LTEKQKTNEIEMVTQQVSLLKEQISKIDVKIKAQIAERDALNQKYGELRQEINQLKTERNGLNENVKTLKQERDRARTKIKQIIEELKAYRQKISELKKKTPKKSHRDLKKEFEAIEWRIQTSTYDMQTEKRQIEIVRQLETQLSLYRKIEQHGNSVIELQSELDRLKETADANHHTLTERAKKSQEIHSEIIAKISELKSVKSEADRLHEIYIRLRTQAQPFRDKLRKLLEARRKRQYALRKENEEQKKNADKTLREKLEVQARNKLQSGEEISWNEFQLLDNGQSEEAST
jgi:uncharacterized coiled-coil DUF342 family protein